MSTYVTETGEPILLVNRPAQLAEVNATGGFAVPSLGQVWPRGTGSHTAVSTTEINIPAFTRSGALIVVSGSSLFYNDTGHTLTLGTVRASVVTAPTGSAVIVDVNRSGTSVFTNPANRPAIAAGTLTATGTPDVTTFAPGHYLTVDVAQVGSATPGSDLTVQIATA